jgi:(1->4)-alpha-D-glucan 1-alpha-D-glucosylmutase
MSETKLNRVPSATYRLQLGESLDFASVRRLVDYLEQLGISDLYLSPLFRSREHSSHGYDVVSHCDIEPTFGDLASFEQLAEDVRARGMGILLDVVPNHMGINDPGNEWWLDVLENGPLSEFAGYFDIDWNRPSESLRDKVLLPFLGDYFGAVLERGEFKIAYGAAKLQLLYGEMRYPLTPSCWPLVLTLVLEKLNDGKIDSAAKTELESIIFELEHLPAPGPNVANALHARFREQKVAARRLAQLMANSPGARSALEAALSAINGDPADRRSFDRLDAVLNAQWYRFAYWRVASDEINYRRFFDVNDLAAIRVEIPDVFSKVHALVQKLLAAGRITGLRIDHPDGLYDPEDYFERLQRLYRDCQAHDESAAAATTRLYILAEKILTGAEELPHQWQIAGTTGYELLNIIGRTLVDADGLSALVESYQRVLGDDKSPGEVVYESKRQILHEAMSSELTMLSSRLYRIAQQSRMSRDFTFTSLLRALREVIACFPAYRTYVRSQGWDVVAEDHSRIAHALRMAKLRNPTMARAMFDFIASVLLLEFPPTLEKEQKEQWREFALRFQQVTSPVAAKGVEDTAFYRYFPLVSLNEVGAELTPAAYSAAEFHRLMQRRAMDWPHALSATATHDTKRGEDSRARLHALSQAPEYWSDLWNWSEKRTGQLLREVNGQPAPRLPERYFLLQTIVGTWPSGAAANTEWELYRDRIRQYMEKGLREAKLNTSWANPAPEYEQAVRDFVTDVLDPAKSADLLHRIDEFVGVVADAGYLNSLAQLVLKICVPGVPDFYQGTELWDFSLVDPDNRRPVDFDRRRELLDELRTQFADDPDGLIESLAASWPDPRIKLYMTWRLLQLRKRYSDLFSLGNYVPLEVRGDRQNNIIAFARTFDGTWVVVIVPRALEFPIEWGDTEVLLPADAGREFHDVLAEQSIVIHDGSADAGIENLQLERDIVGSRRAETTKTLIEPRRSDAELQRCLTLTEVLRVWPVAVLVSPSV